jgi:hypothetical protein
MSSELSIDCRPRFYPSAVMLMAMMMGNTVGCCRACGGQGIRKPGDVVRPYFDEEQPQFMTAPPQVRVTNDSHTSGAWSYKKP